MSTLLKLRCGPLFLALVIIASSCGFAQEKADSTPPGEEQAGFKEFASLAQKYAGLHRKIEGSLPKLKTNSSPALIDARQQTLAEHIQQARENAHPGDIFSPAASEAFHRVIARTFRGSQGDNARATIRQGAPVANAHLQVNHAYPSKLPHTTVPPTLLQKFPKLPPELAYRIVGKDLVLLDVKANLIADVMRQALP